MKNYKDFIKENKTYPDFVQRILDKFGLNEEKYNSLVKRLNSFYKNVFKPLDANIQEIDSDEVRFERGIESMIKFHNALNGLPTKSVILTAFTELEDIYPQNIEIEFAESLIAPVYRCTIAINDNSDFEELRKLIETVSKCAKRCKLKVFKYRTNGSDPLKFEFTMRSLSYVEPQ